MTIQDIKYKYGVDNLTFYSLLDEKKEPTQWTRARNEDLSHEFIMHEHVLKALKDFPERSDVSLKSLRKYDTNGIFLYTRHIISLIGSVFKIALFEKEHTITVIPTLQKVYLDKVYDFDAEYDKLAKEFLFSTPDLRDKVALELEVTFSINSVEWKVPYVVILEKILEKSKSSRTFVYRKCRARLLKLNEIEVLDDTLLPFFSARLTFIRSEAD